MLRREEPGSVRSKDGQPVRRPKPRRLGRNGADRHQTSACGVHVKIKRGSEGLIVGLAMLAIAVLIFLVLELLF